jgi:plastocyanin
MLKKYRWPVFVAVVAIALPVVATGAGAADKHQGPAKATVTIRGMETFRPNFYQQTFRFPDEPTVIRSGGTLTWNNMSTEGHSMSLVAKGDLPTSFNGNDVQGALFGAHNLGGPGGPPILVVDGGVATDDDAQHDADTLTDFDTVSHSNATPTPPTIGDSVLVDNPSGSNGFYSTVSVLVTAPAGTTLHYYCIFHPQMQGTIQVTG